MQTIELTRRDLLKTGGALVVSFAFGAVPRRAAAQTAASTASTDRPLDAGEVDGLIVIHADGSVTLYTSKVVPETSPVGGAPLVR